MHIISRPTSGYATAWQSAENDCLDNWPLDDIIYCPHFALSRLVM